MRSRTTLRDINWALAVEFGTCVQLEKVGRDYRIKKRALRHLKPEFDTIRLTPAGLRSSIDEIVDVVRKLFLQVLDHTVACRCCPEMEPIVSLQDLVTAGWRKMEFTPAGDTTWLGTCPKCMSTRAERRST